MGRPNFWNTIGLIIVFAVGILVGRYVPEDLLPGPQPGDSTSVTDRLGSFFSDVGDLASQAEEIAHVSGYHLHPGGNHSDGNGDQPGGPDDNPVAGTADAGTNAAPVLNHDEAVADARDFVSGPLLIAQVVDTQTLIVARSVNEKRILKLYGVDAELTGFRDFLRSRLVGRTVWVRIRGAEVDGRGRIVGTVWFVKSVQEAERGSPPENLDPATSINRALEAEIMQQNDVGP